MNRFRTFWPKGGLRGGILILFFFITPLWIPVTQAQPTTTPAPDQKRESPPLLQARSPIYADIDTVNRRLLMLVEEGLWQYDLDEDTWTFLSALDSFDESLNKIEFAYDENSGQAFLWDRGVGRVFTINMVDYSIQRIDHSFNHRNQFEHQAVVKDSTIYAFGGYGYWSWKNYITYYNHDLKEWNIQNVSPDSEVPSPRIPLAGAYQPDLDQMYIFGGTTPVNELRADDQYTVNKLIHDIWCFSFSTNQWDRLGEMELDAEYYYRGSRYRRFGRVNSVSESIFSRSSGFWYIPVITQGRGDIVRLLPVDTYAGKIYSPVLMKQYESDEFIGSNFMYDPLNREIVLIGVKTISGSESFPIEVVRIPEDSILSQINDRDGSLTARWEWLAGGAAILALLFIAYLKWGKRGSTTEDEVSEKIEEGYLRKAEWLKNDEKTLLITLIRESSFMESDQLEVKVWPDIDNYDYRRKIRNETINAINDKFRHRYGVDKELIIRKKDPDDNRRYLYGLNDEYV